MVNKETVIASEYPKNKIRFNAVAPGVVDTPLHKNVSNELLKTRFDEAVSWGWQDKDWSAIGEVLAKKASV